MKVQRRQLARFHIEENRPTSHPLHLSISEKDAESLGVPFNEDSQLCFLSVCCKRSSDLDFTFNSSFPVTPSSGGQISVSTSPSGSLPFPTSCSYDPHIESSNICCDQEWLDIAACVWIRKEQGDIVDRKSRSEYSDFIVLNGTAEFLAHYQIAAEDDLYVRSVKIYPIEKLVIGVSNFNAYRWLQRVNFCTGLLVEVCLHPILVRENDIFLAPYSKLFLSDTEFDPSFYFDMQVLECCPLRVGRITVNTEIILSYIDQDVNRKDAEFQLDSPTKAMASKSVDQYLISDFCQLMRPDSLTLNAKTIGVQKSSTQPLYISFNYQVVQQHILWKRLLIKPQQKVTFDPLYYIGMTKQTMLQHGFFEESLVRVSLDDTTQPFTVPFRLGLVKCITESLENTNKVFISPLMLFNLQMTCAKPHGIIGPIRIEKYHYDEDEHEVDSGTTSSSWSSKIPLAREVQISIVISPYYSPRAIHTEAIKAFFNVPRLMTKGDIIPIRSTDDPEFSSMGMDSDRRNPVVFFKVVKIDGPEVSLPCYICDSSSTRLIQVGSVHSYVPVTATSYLSRNPLTYWEQTYLFGLNKYADRMEELIRPLLHNSIHSPHLKDVLRSLMLIGPSGCGKTTMATAVARRLNLHMFKVNCHRLYGESARVMEARIKDVFNAASNFSPCIMYLHSIHALGKDKERNMDDPRVASSFQLCLRQQRRELLEYPVIVIGSTHSPNMLAADVRDSFLHEIQIEAPNEEERSEILDGLLQNVNYSGDLSGQYLAQRTAGFVLGDMTALISHAKQDAYEKVCKLCGDGRRLLSYDEEEDLSMAGVVVQQENFVSALDKLQAAHSDTIGAPKIPNVTWADVGGLSDVKSEILDTVQLPLQYPELLAAGLRRSGVLLYGPPGTGKTLLAKAVATECSLNFLSVKGPELINMYVGQSEQNVREVFHRARSATPCVIFFDELDSLAPNRGKSGDSGGVMDRVVSQLLAELDGLHKSCDVFVIGATNRPDLLDPALLRPGRFDKLLYLGVSDDKDSQLRVMRALTRKFKLETDCDLSAIADQCPKNLTGADFYALCSDAMLNAIKRRIQKLDKGETTDQKNVMVSKQDFLDALSSLTPSLSEQELDHYKQLQQEFNRQ
ncbi:peroxisomal ATPase PEX6-like [Argopecten irradians]|uniref:peroxisomal ATPase PEX6-like n=1 Tax=Argopecten irradians TaxID=31199 RepID=UPI0037218CF8